MKIEGFSVWKKWSARSEFESDLEWPGVYALAVSTKDLSNKPFSLIEEVRYFGMTRAKAGLKSRLGQFNNTIIGKIGHGGAERFLGAYEKDMKLLKKNLYVSINFMKCDVKSNNPEDLKKIGKILEFEYICFAKYVEKHDELPRFNNFKKSPKRKNRV